MNKKHFVIHLLPPRADFAQTMTDEERGLMQAHVDYWKKHMQEGTMLVFGPVLHPKGSYGLGIVATDSEESLQDLLRNDPASQLGQYEAFPMMAVTPAG